MTVRFVYLCPVHGLIESPTWHDGHGLAEDAGYYCPINLTAKDGRGPGITDDVCGKDVTGPVQVNA